MEVAEKDAGLADILEERAAIRAACGLPDNAETIALLTIGADERMATIETEMAKFNQAVREENKA